MADTKNSANPQVPEARPFPETLARVAARFPGSLLETSTDKGETTAVVPAGQIVDICRFLKEEPGLEYVFLVDLCAIHWPEREYTYEVVYLLHSFVGNDGNRNDRNDRIRLKVRLNEDGRVATMTGLFPGANWHEREAFDLVGVVFEGHPDLRRILMPEEYDAFPLRRDFPVKGY